MAETWQQKEKFNQQKYDRVQMKLPKGKKETWQVEAEKRNISLTQFIIDAVDTKIYK